MAVLAAWRSYGLSNHCNGEAKSKCDSVWNPWQKLIINTCFKLYECRDSDPRVSGDNTAQRRKAEPWRLVERKPCLSNPSAFWVTGCYDSPRAGGCAGGFFLRCILDAAADLTLVIAPEKKFNRKQTIIMFFLPSPFCLFLQYYL